MDILKSRESSSSMDIKVPDTIIANKMLKKRNLINCHFVYLSRNKLFPNNNLITPQIKRANE